MADGIAARTRAVLLLVLLVAGCAPPPDAGASPNAPSLGVAATSPSTGSAQATPDLEHPIGIIAIGHSGLTGEGTLGPLAPNPAASWATGTMAEVNSVYTRLLALDPAIEGHVANAAAGGAPASTLASQATVALAHVPVPQLAIIQTVDNDIRCDASNAEAVAADLLEVLELIHERSPNTRILVVGQAGRPRIEFVEALVAAVPAQRQNLTWDDECSFFTSGGVINEAGFERLTAAIDTYEAANARVCATVPNCSTDGGVRRAYEDKLENFAADYAHFNVRGQAAMAELIWPVVEELLGL